MLCYAMLYVKMIVMVGDIRAMYERCAYMYSVQCTDGGGCDSQ